MRPRSAWILRRTHDRRRIRGMYSESCERGERGRVLLENRGTISRQNRNHSTGLFVPGGRWRPPGQLGTLFARRGRPRLQLHQPVRGLRKNRKLRQVSANHGDFIAAVKPRASVAVFVNLVWYVLALRNRKSLRREEIRLACEQADAINAVPLRLG